MQKALSSAAFATALVALATLAQAQKKPSDVPIESFFKRAQFESMQLSPNGRRLAAIAPLKSRSNLVVIDLEKNSRNIITDFSSIDVGNFYWVNDDRLCMQVADGQNVTGEFN